MIRGLISIGTNSTRALVVEVDGATRTLLHRSTGTRIGEGLKERGHLDEAAMQRTLAAIAEHYEAVRALAPNIGVIATSALRRADNAPAFAAQVREITNSNLHIISGDDEARYSYAGAVSGIAAEENERFGVLDTGGGSTEYAVGTKAGAEHIVSCEIGAVRITEALPQLAGCEGEVPEAIMDAARTLADEALAKIGAFPQVERLLFVGGSATTTIAVLAGKRESFAYAELTRGDLESVIERLRALDIEKRKALPGMNPQRADILLGGAIVLDAAFRRTLHERATVSTNDILLGYLLQ